jgi:hypothetical protein
MRDDGSYELSFERLDVYGGRGERGARRDYGRISGWDSAMAEALQSAVERLTSSGEVPSNE